MLRTANAVVLKFVEIGYVQGIIYSVVWERGFFYQPPMQQAKPPAELLYYVVGKSRDGMCLISTLFCTMHGQAQLLYCADVCGRWDYLPRRTGGYLRAANLEQIGGGGGGGGGESKRNNGYPISS